MHHHRVRPGERLAQPGEVLVMMKRVTAAPVHQPDVRVGQPLPVVVIGGTGTQQHVGDPRHRDERGSSVPALRQPRHRNLGRWLANQGCGPVAVAEAAARQPDLAEHGSEHHAEPQRLLPVPGTLQRPADGHQGARRRHLVREFPDARRRHAGDLLSPRGILNDAVCLAAKVTGEPRVADCVTVQEAGVGQAVGVKHLGEREHQRGVGAGTRRDPLGLRLGGRVVAERAHRDEPAAPYPGGAHPAAGVVPGDPAR